MQITPPNNLLPGLMDFLKKAFNDSVMRFDEHTYISDDIDTVCRFLGQGGGRGRRGSACGCCSSTPTRQYSGSKDGRGGGPHRAAVV